jgi:hypothetical protein
MHFIGLPFIIIWKCMVQAAKTSQTVNKQNLLLPPNTPFSLLGLDFSTDCSWSRRVIRCCRESVAGVLFWTLLTGTGLLSGWLVPAFFLGHELLPSSPIKPEHYITKDIPLIPYHLKTHIQNSWAHEYKSIRWWTNQITRLHVMTDR